MSELLDRDVWLEWSPAWVKAHLVAVGEGEATVSAVVELTTALPRQVTPFALNEGLEAEQRDIETMLKALTSVTAAVCGEGQGRRVRQLVLNPSGRSVVAIGRENTVLTPAVLMPEGCDLPKPPAALLDEAVAREVRRYANVTAWLCHWMSGEWIGLLDQGPLGLPTLATTGDYDPERSAWDKAQATLTWSPLLVPERAVMAQVIPLRAKALGVPAFTPIVGRLTGRPREARG
ncbi:MAG: hypothetical protein AAFS10_00740 [Myxococcota bacterium]